MSMISVVTVCYNEEKDIKRTIESVLNQNYTDFEYIICDGLSKDKTVQIAESYKSQFLNKGIKYSIYSEKDGGVYFGMNNGIKKAEGKYIWFLNAGDWFSYNDVLSKMSDFAIRKELPDVVYGNCFFVDKHVPVLKRATHTDLIHEMSLGHPATMVLTSVMKEKYFDTQYRIAADYNLFLNLFLEEKKFEHLDEAVSFFTIGGISTVNIKDSLAEAERIRLSNGIQGGISNVALVNKKDKLYEMIKTLIPTRMWKWWNTKVKKRDWIDM